MDNLLLSEGTRRQIELILRQPPHAVLICGPAGSGKQTLAEHISAKLLEVDPKKLSDQPYFRLIQKPTGKQEISIDAVRDVIRQLRLKPAIGNGQIRRILLISEAHSLSTEAQNALLKAIEEPPAATAFILTVLSENSVLPTIASRAQKLKIGTASLNDANKFFDQSYDQNEISSAWQLSGGSAGLLAALLQNQSDHPLKGAVTEAKNILRANRYERALILDELSAKKEDFGQVLDALSRVLAALHRSAISGGKGGAAAKLLTARRQVDKAAASLGRNTSPRLIALNLALSLTI